MPGLRSHHDREIARLAVPAFGALIAEPLYVLADTAVVGRIGTVELAGLAVASSALLTGYAIFIFLAYGTTAAVSRLLGAGEDRAAAHQAVQGLWLAAAIGVVVTALVVGFASPIVELLGATGAVRTNALVYLRISALGITFQLLTFAGTGYLRGLQDTRTPLVVAVGAATANLVIELVLIAGFGFGIGASALSTVIAQVGGAVVYLRLITTATSRLGAALRPDWTSIRRLGRAGWDLLVRTVALRASLTLFTAVAARIGAAEVGAHEVAFAVWSFLALALDAIAIAGQAMIGRFLGAGDTVTAREVGRRMLELGTAAGVAVGGAVLVVRPVLPDVFSSDPQVLSLAGFLLVFVALLQPVNGAVFVLDGLLIGAGDMAFLARAMVAAALLAVPAAVAVGVLDLGIGWVWAAITVLMVARLAVLAVRWRSGAWAVTGAERDRGLQHVVRLLVEGDEPHLCDPRARPLGRGEEGLDGDLARLVERVAEDAGRDRGDRHRAGSHLVGDLDDAPVAGGQLLRLALVAAVPDGTDGVDDPADAWLQVEGIRGDRVAGVAGGEPGARLGQPRARGAVDRAAHPAAGRELAVGRVHDGVDGLLGDVATDDGQPHPSPDPEAALHEPVEPVRVRGDAQVTVDLAHVEGGAEEVAGGREEVR